MAQLHFIEIFKLTNAIQKFTGFPRLITFFKNMQRGNRLSFKYSSICSWFFATHNIARHNFFFKHE